MKFKVRKGKVYSIHIPIDKILDYLDQQEQQLNPHLSRLLQAD
jgi:hypothetical protein